jgi:DNA-binding NtrC family response regulator
VQDLPPRVTEATPRGGAVPRTNEELKAAKAHAAEAAAGEVEVRFLTDLLRGAHGNVADAARRVGMNWSWLHQLLQRHRIDPKTFR